MSGMTFDLEREIRGQTSHTIVGLNSVIHYLVLQHEVHLKDSFTTLGNKLMENDKPRFKVLVITSLNVATSAQGVELKKVIEGTEKLLHKNFSSEKGDAKNISNLLSTNSRNDGNQYILVSLFGYKSKTDDIEVVGTALGITAAAVGGYVAYLATSDGVYSKAKFGSAADREKFRGRGIAQFMLTIFQLTSYWKSYGKKQESIFLHCDQKKVEGFKNYGFTLVDSLDKKQWPSQIKKLHIAVGIASSDVKRFKLQSMRIDKAIAGSLQKTLSQETVPTTTQETTAEEGVAQAPTNAEALRKPIPRKNKAKEPSTNIPTQKTNSKVIEKPDTTVTLPTLPTALKLSRKTEKALTTKKVGERKLKKKKITNSLLVRNDDGSSSDPPELSDDSSSTATDASQMQRELATVTNRQPKTDATKVLSSKTSVTHEGLSEDDSLSSALIRKIYTTFTKRENGGQTTDVHHKIETSFKRKLKPAEWVLVQNKIDELLDNADKKRLSNFVDEKGTSVSPTFASLLIELYDEKLRHLKTDEVRDIVEKECCGMLTNHIWLLAERFLSSIIDGGPRGTSGEKLVGGVNPAAQEPPTVDPAAQQSHTVDPDAQESPTIDHAPPEGRIVDPAATEGQPTTLGQEVVVHKTYYTVNDFMESICSHCTRSMIHDDKVRKCLKCNNVVHDLCGTSYKRFEEHDDNLNQGCLCKTCVATESIFLCYHCGIKMNAVTYRVSVRTTGDSMLTQEWTKNVGKQRRSDEHNEQRKQKKVKLSKQEEEQLLLAKAKELQRWLTGIQSVKYIRSAEKYHVKSNFNDEVGQKTLDKEFVEDGILLMDKGYISTVKKDTSTFHDVLPIVKENVTLRDELWSGPQTLYDTYQKCMTGKQWRFVKVSHQAKHVKEQPEDGSWQLVQDSSELTNPQQQYYISLKGDDEEKVKYVPKYYLFLWRVHLTETKMNILMKNAWKTPNKWVGIQEGTLTYERELHEWLTGIVSVKYIRSADKYEVKSVCNDEISERMLHKSFVEDEILLMDKEFIAKVKKDTSTFHVVEAFVEENVTLRNELWSGPKKIYDTYQKCITGKQWTSIKVNHQAKNVKEQPDDGSWQLVQDSSELTNPQKQYYISLQDGDKRKVDYVPKYFLFLWRKQVTDEEMDTLMKNAWKRPNKWVNVQEGRCRCTSAIPRTLEIVSYENKFLQNSEATCVITSLANAMMYINDTDAANTLMDHKELSLATTRRLQFVANLMNKLHYNVIKLNQFDILSNTSRWPTVCGLTGSDGGTTHAVTVCGEVLFDSNTKIALKLNRENLNWSCGAEGVSVEYVNVHLGYRFEFNKTIPKHFRNV